MYTTLILHGRRSLVLQKWRNGFSAFSNSFSSASAVADVSLPQDGRKEKIFTVSYLVNSLGLTRKLAESISRKVSSEGKGDPDSILSLLRSHGFTDSQISSIVSIYPRLFILDAEKSIGPKLEFLQSRGASTSELTEILSKVPTILARKGEKTISIYYDFVKEIIEADKSSKHVKLCHSLPQGSKQENKIRNLSVLRELGMPQKLLFSILISDNRICSGKERFEESVKKVVDMGFDPTTFTFVEALQAVYTMSVTTMEAKVNVYKRLGFDVEDVWTVFKKWPKFLALSEKNIVNSFETFLGLGFSRDEFVMMVKHYPLVLGFSIEKRIVPRCNVIKALISKGLMGSDLPSVSYVLTWTDNVFLERCVMKHDDKQLVTELMAIFTTRDRVS
ncbi:hypothetical protein EUTSA_v10024133mg [Eutrema salsugineum]|uniref:Mitochondrial transcription termination factor family protein n=1 Tax=Eutrema salsugineum TaxID=72664 RepID=V4MDC7_EUTSA|nr:transcription termination factor MTERF4, chloroplastic [Eutrema salsugineum]ESQ29231.1 hypothetical protein EUTSA_v10024133mg [Eutrema salsugineum]